MRVLIAAAVVMGAAALAARPAQAAPAPSVDLDGNPAFSWDGIPTAEADQTNDVFEEAILLMDPRNYIPAGVPADLAARNLRAFLDTIAVAEGTAGWGNDGYNIMFGRRTFTSYADHPRQYFPFTNRNGEQLRTSAAGRYQFIVPTWDSLAAKLGLSDFGPANQDAGAIELIRQKGALADAQAGRLAMALEKCRRVWASLPGAGYAQPERSFSQLLAAFQSAGGTEVTA